MTIYSLIVLLSQFSNTCSMSSSNCCFLTCMRFLRRQVRWSGDPISLRIFQFIVIHTIKGFSVVNEAEADFFFLNSLAFSMIQQRFAIWSLAPLPLWNPALHLKVLSSHTAEAQLEDFEHNHASMWNEHNYMIVWTFFGIAFLCDRNENWPLPVLWLLLSFQICCQIECSIFTSSSFRILNSLAGISSSPLALFMYAS